MLTSSVLLLLDAAFAAAGAAGIGDHLAGAVAGRAGPLDHEEALLRAHLAAAVAHAAAARAGAGLGALPPHGSHAADDIDRHSIVLPWNASSRLISMS